jgi:hypothetical protein
MTREANQTGKHTPGPWTFQRIEASDDNRIVYCLIGPKDELKRTTGVAYAGTYGKTRHLTVTGIRQSDEECEANARLIAAAPDLLAIAVRVVKEHDDERDPPDPGCFECTEGVVPMHLEKGPCLYHAAKAAIRKATTQPLPPREKEKA